MPPLGRGAHSGRAQWLGGRAAGAGKAGDGHDEPPDTEVQLTHTRCAAGLGEGLPSSAIDCRRQPFSFYSSNKLLADLRCVSVSSS